MRTQVLGVLPKIDSYRGLQSSNDAYQMKLDIISFLEETSGGLDKVTFILQDELALQFFEKDCKNWVSCLSTMDDTILNKISPMSRRYYELLVTAEKLDRKLFTEISKEIKYPDKSKIFDEYHLNKMSLQSIRLRIGKALEMIYNTFDMVIYISRGNSFMRSPKPELNSGNLIAKLDIKDMNKEYYYSGVNVDKDIFDNVRRNLIL